MREDAYIGLGSNLGDSVAEIKAACLALRELPTSEWVSGSPLYRTAPISEVPQADFINAVCRLRTELMPRQLLDELLVIEIRQGRVRGGGKDGPRSLDLDLLLYGDRVVSEPGLQIPHPRLHGRAFVLYPLADIAPELTIPGHGPVRALLAGCADQRVEQLRDTPC